MTKKVYCDHCGKQIKVKRQFVIRVYSCKTGTAQDSSGSVDEEFEFEYDYCAPCAKLLKELK